MTKRLSDIVISFLALVLIAPILLACYLITCVDTGSGGMFFQKRVGQHGRLFTICKLRTIHPKTRKISAAGRFFRNYKIDELPQLFNVLLGTMSLVGPRPDVEGYYDKLEGEARKILELKPGITSSAALKYSDEAALLTGQENPLQYNDEVIFPDKVRMNLEYYYKRNLKTDMNILLSTIIKLVRRE